MRAEYQEQPYHSIVHVYMYMCMHTCISQAHLYIVYVCLQCTVWARACMHTYIRTYMCVWCVVCVFYNLFIYFFIVFFKA